MNELVDIGLTDLLLPILLGAVAVFLASFVTHMVLKYHWSDYKALPDEELVMAALRDSGTGPGQYSMPHCADGAGMKDPQWQERYAAGPTGFMVVQKPGALNMGPSLLQSFLFNLVVSAVTAWLASEVLAREASDGSVFRLTSVVAFLAFGGAYVWAPIWKGETWSSCLKYLLDALIYGACLGGVFVVFWP